MPLFWPGGFEITTRDSKGYLIARSADEDYECYLQQKYNIPPSPRQQIKHSTIPHQHLNLNISTTQTINTQAINISTPVTHDLTMCALQAFNFSTSTNHHVNISTGIVNLILVGSYRGTRLACRPRPPNTTPPSPVRASVVTSSRGCACPMVMKPAPSPPHTYHNGHLGQRFRGSARANDLDDRCASRWPNSCKSTRKPPKMSSDVRATHSTLRERPVAHARKISPRADSARLARSVSRRRSNEARRDNEAARWSARAAPSGRERLPRAHTARQQHRSAGSRVARRPRGCSWLMMRPGTAGRLQSARPCAHSLLPHRPARRRKLFRGVDV